MGGGANMGALFRRGGGGGGGGGGRQQATLRHCNWLEKLNSFLAN